MGKYDNQLGDLKNRLVSASSILIALPAQISPEKLAAGLALYLSLEQMGKQIDIVSEGTVLVAHTNLYGVGRVKNALPTVGGGNFTLTLEGVVSPDGTVPSLEKLDWFPEGNNLNLVFHVLPGQKFQPTKINPKYDSTSASSLVFVLGASNLSELGGIYVNNQQFFASSYVVNIDTNPANANFGQVNIVDQQASTSEIVAQILQTQGLVMNSDIASNILTGIYSATNNLTTNVNPDTFMVVGQAMQLGGKVTASGENPIPQPNQAQMPVTQIAPQPAQPTQPAFDYSQLIPQQPAVAPTPANTPVQQAVPVQPQATQPQVAQAPVTEPAPVAAPLMNNPFIPPVADNFTFSGAATSSPIPTSPVTSLPSSNPQQETPSGEITVSSNPESEVQNPQPDWLTPKVFKGTSLG